MEKVRLLVVDDEAMLRDLLRRYLERAGYDVETCAQPGEALEKFAASPDAFALVITDLSLDGMTGEEMLERMRGLRPDVKGLIASGYPHVPRLAGVGFLQKPFVPQMLMDAVQQALAA